VVIANNRKRPLAPAKLTINNHRGYSKHVFYFFYSSTKNYWTLHCIRHYCPLKCLIKTKLQHFQLCPFGVLNGFHFIYFLLNIVYVWTVLNTEDKNLFVPHLFPINHHFWQIYNITFPWKQFIHHIYVTKSEIK
jgi:hypothetical protein